MAAPVITSIVPVAGTVQGLPCLAVHFTGDGGPYRLYISGGGDNRQITGITSSPVIVGDTANIDFSATANFDDLFRISNVVGGVEVFSDWVKATYQTSLYTAAKISSSVVRVTFNEALMPSPPLEASATTLSNWVFVYASPNGQVTSLAVTKVSTYVYDISSANIGIATGKAFVLAGSFQLQNGSTFWVKTAFLYPKFLASTLTATPGVNKITVGFSTVTSIPTETTSNIRGLLIEYSLDGGTTIALTTEIAPGQFEITGLTAGQAYSIIMRWRGWFFSGQGTPTYLYRGTTTGDWSAPVVATPIGTPGPPTITAFTLTPRSDGYFDYTIAYNPPTNDGGSPILEYQYEYSYPVVDTPSSMGLANPFTRSSQELNSLASDFNAMSASYRVRIRARNAIGWGEYTPQAQAYIESTYYSVSLLNATTIRLSFNPNLMPAPPKSVSASTPGDALWAPGWNFITSGDTVGSLASGVTKIDAYTFDIAGLTTTASRLTSYGGAAGLQLTNGSTFRVAIMIRDLTPTAPILTGYTSSSGAVTITVTPAASQPANVFALRYDYSIDGGVTFTPATLTANTLTLSGLTNGTVYNVQLRAAAIASGAYLFPWAVGPWSNVLPVVPGVLPTAPNLTALTAGNASLTAAFTAPSNPGSSPISDYQYNLNGGAYISAGTTTSPITITGVTNGTTYAVTLKAVNATGAGPASNSSSATPLGPPDAPTIQYIVPADSALSVTFTPPVSNGGSPITGYQYRIDGGTPVSIPTTPNAFTISGLTNGTSYTIDMRAMNALGTGPWSAPVAQTPAIQEPEVVGYGKGDWGESGWGTGLPTFSQYGAGRAYAVGDRVIRVELPVEPQHSDSAVYGDALNPKTWQVTAIASGRILTPLSVAQINPFVYEILTLQMLESALYQMRLTAPALLTVGGATLAPQSWQFAGSQLVSNVTNQSKTTAAGLALRDIANPQTPNSPVGGTLQITAGGDYQSVTGEALVRKLIIRRLISKKGDFFHLPNYGAGLRVKDVVPTTDLRKLATEIERQVQLEPEVEAAAVSLSYTAASSALVVQLQVRLRQTGQDVSVSFAVPSGTMQL